MFPSPRGALPIGQHQIIKAKDSSMSDTAVIDNVVSQEEVGVIEGKKTFESISQRFGKKVVDRSRLSGEKVKSGIYMRDGELRGKGAQGAAYKSAQGAAYKSAQGTAYKSTVQRRSPRAQCREQQANGPRGREWRNHNSRDCRRRSRSRSSSRFHKSDGSSRRQYSRWGNRGLDTERLVPGDRTWSRGKEVKYPRHRFESLHTDERQKFHRDGDLSSRVMYQRHVRYDGMSPYCTVYGGGRTGRPRFERDNHRYASRSRITGGDRTGHVTRCLESPAKRSCKVSSQQKVDMLPSLQELKSVHGEHLETVQLHSLKKSENMDLTREEEDYDVVLTGNVGHSGADQKPLQENSNDSSKHFEDPSAIQVDLTRDSDVVTEEEDALITPKSNMTDIGMDREQADGGNLSAKIFQLQEQTYKLGKEPKVKCSCSEGEESSEEEPSEADEEHAAMAWRQKNMPSEQEVRRRKKEVADRIAKSRRARKPCNSGPEDPIVLQKGPSINVPPEPDPAAMDSEWRLYYRLYHTARIASAGSFVQVLRMFNVPCDDPKKIKLAYMQAVRMYHPDSNSKARAWSSDREKIEAEEIMKIINQQKPQDFVV